jgi:hypothetical protein
VRGTNHFALTFALVALLALVLLPANLVFSQSPSRTIQWAKSPIGSNKEKTGPSLQWLQQIDGVEIEDVTVAGKSQIIGESFIADNDWLRTLTFRVKNVSDLKLVRIQMTLVLLEMANESPDLAFCYGCAAAEKEKGISPGEVVELKMLGGEFYDWVRSRIEEKGPLSRITKAELRYIHVTPPKGPTWFSGCVKTTNPRNACRQSKEPAPPTLAHAFL